jgi:ribonuclease HI
MPWVRALLHGQTVFARANDDRSLRVESGRVDVCYALEAAKVYKARPANVAPEPGAPLLPDDACALKSEPRLKGAASAGHGRAGSPRPSSSSAVPEAPLQDAIIAYADGACSGNPGPAGLGAVIIDGPTRTEISEHLGIATNNIAELAAIERVLESVTDKARNLIIYTDSAYSIGVLSKGWKAKANVVLIESLRKRLKERPKTAFVHVRGHAGIELNERADELAREAVKSGRSRTERVG